MKKAALIMLVVVLAWVAGIVLIRPTSRYEKMSEAQIQAELLHDIPLGSSSEVVRSYLRRKTGREPGYARNFYTVEGRPIIRDGKILNLRYYAGAANATLANYTPGGAFSLVSTNVQTRWEFDQNDRLIDLRVTKVPFGP
ncbi:hypothetical protein ACXR0O_21335 [Verrucomicrobiota bacterium sgz303538]